MTNASDSERRSGSDDATLEDAGPHSRDEAEAALAKSLARFRELVENIDDIVFSLGVDGRIEYVSPAIERSYGYAPDELVGRHFTEFVHPEDLPGLATSFARTLSGDVEPFEFRAFDPKGRVHFMRSRSRLRMTDGRPAGVDGVMIDITERMRSEQDLVEFNERLERLTRLVQDLSRARHVDEIADVVRVAARGLVGSDGSTFVLRDGDRCHYVDEDAIAPLWKGKRFPLSACISGWVMTHKQPAVIEDVYADERVPHDAYRATFVKSLAMIPIRSDDPVGAIGTYWANAHVPSVSDVRLLQALAESTAIALENVRVLHELEESRARARAIYDHLPGATFVWRRAGEGFVLADFNKAAEAMTSGAASRALGKPPWSLLHGFPSLAEDLAACHERRGAVGREVDFTPPGQACRRRLVATYGFVPSDMVVLHAEDVTERRQTEEKLVLSQRLEAVGRLAGGVAHDFNNMLSVITSYTGFAIDDLREGDPIRADLEEVRKASDRAATLIRQLLAFSRKQVMKPEVLSLNEIVAGFESMLRRLLGEDIEVVIDLAQALGTVKADPGQIEQVVMNLSVNARDAMPRGGTLRIETRNVDLVEPRAESLFVVAPGRYVSLSVTDTGYGMEAGTLEHVFEPFFTTKEQGKGTGLGLATVYGIVKQSGGYVLAASEPGRGSSFTVYLPRVDAPTAADRRRTSPAAPCGSETLLLVEDEDAVRKIAERILRAAGYEVLAAANGAEALLLCEKHAGTIDLLVTDVVMPQMSGRELAERLTTLRPQLKVLFMSGYTDDAIVRHGVLEPGTSFIGKPFSPGELTRKVREVLDTGPGAAEPMDSGQGPS